MKKDSIAWQHVFVSKVVNTLESVKETVFFSKTQTYSKILKFGAAFFTNISFQYTFYEIEAGLLNICHYDLQRNLPILSRKS